VTSSRAMRWRFRTWISDPGLRQKEKANALRWPFLLADQKIAAFGSSYR
jgi:hypothetical protein